MNTTLADIKARMNAIGEELQAYLLEQSSTVITDERTACDLFIGRLTLEEREHFEVAFLDFRHKLIGIERLFSGTVNASEVHPRIVVQRALQLNACAIIMAHNHPSGNPEPSSADRTLTRRIQDACQLVDVRVLDHIIVGAGCAPYSFAARGQI